MRIEEVRIDKVKFRVYPIILSDNPSTSSGPPIGLGWRYDSKETLISDIDSYETIREEPGIRRMKMELIIALGV